MWKLLKQTLRRWLPAVRYTGQISHYVVGPDVAGYIKNRYGHDCQLAAAKEIDQPGEPLIMSDFKSGRGGCTITALTYVFDYHRRSGSFPDIEPTVQAVFSSLETIAMAHGYKPLRGSTNPLRISSIVNHAWKHYGLRGSGSAHYWGLPRKMMAAIDQNQPALLNISFRYYRFHTVTLIGYQIWRQTSRKRVSEVLLLRVFDGWTKTERYIDYKAMRWLTGRDFSPHSLTLIVPED